MSFRLRAAFAASILTLAAGMASAESTPARTPSPAGARVYVISPADGETVSSPVLVRFGLSGMGVAPAGIVFPNTGHHHLVIDSELPPLDRPLPADSKHIHFGTGATEAKIELPPGRHTLRLVLGDHAHAPHDPPVVSDPVTITVE
ncbi:hypothetical protein MYXO_03796 [Myxococcaceae bacterium]|jgi:hypothetical protein|nr:hypothetical protein MYXO_03796 [Myxococcaceae bacterium]